MYRRRTRTPRWLSSMILAESSISRMPNVSPTPSSASDILRMVSGSKSWTGKKARLP